MTFNTEFGQIEAMACECGAITVTMPNGDNYSMPPREFDLMFPDAFSGDVPKTFGSCNYSFLTKSLELHMPVKRPCGPFGIIDGPEETPRRAFLWRTEPVVPDRPGQ